MATKKLKQKINKINELATELSMAIWHARNDFEKELEKEDEIEVGLCTLDELLSEDFDHALSAIVVAAQSKAKKKTAKHTEPCPDCGSMKLYLVSDANTDWYGNLKHYKCTGCQETYVSQDDGELATAAVSY